MKKEMKIAQLTRVTFIISVIAVLVSCFCGFEVMLISNQRSASNERQLEAQKFSRQMKDASDFLTNQMRLYSVTGDQQFYDAYMNELNVDKKRETAIEALNDMGMEQSELDFMAQSKQHSDALVPLEVAAAELAGKGKLEEAQLKMFGQDYIETKAKVDAAVASFDQHLNDRLAKEAAKIGIRLNIMIGLANASLLVIFLINLNTFLLNRRKVVRPVAVLRDSCEHLANGDLHYVIPLEESTSEIGQLTGSLKRMRRMLVGYIEDISKLLGSMAAGNMCISVDREYIGDFVSIKSAMEEIVSSMRQTLTGIHDASDQVAGSSATVSEGAQMFSQGTTEQASSVEQLASAMEGISAQIKETADHAITANKNASQVGGDVETSNAHMQQMVQAMEEISARSNEIGKIIKTIEDIAFQTNILALNAAVEAARAGAAGKGFAVVADEVRNLAGKSAEAAKNTTALIESSMQAVANGNRIAGETASSLGSVVENARMIVGSIDEISKAAGRQADAVAEISHNIDQISSVVQSNSATAEQSAAASQELSGQARTLNNLVSQFKLSEDGAADLNDSYTSQTEPALF